MRGDIVKSEKKRRLRTFKLECSKHMASIGDTCLLSKIAEDTKTLVTEASYPI